MIKISMVAIMAMMISGCSVNNSCSGSNIKWFWENDSNITSDCNNSKKDPFDVKEFNNLSIVVKNAREDAISDCKKGEFVGYAESKSDLHCSNGEIKDGCVVTSTGFMCGDVTFTSFKNSAQTPR